MQDELVNELLTILRAVKIIAPDSLQFANEVTPPRSDEADGPAQQDACVAMTQHLGRLLYLQCYCRKFTGDIDHREISSPADSEFLKSLSHANTSREYLSRGWRVLRCLPTGHFVAEKNGLTRVLFPGEFISRSDFRGRIEEGISISIFRPRESTTMHPGFYYVYGEAFGDDQDDRDLLRFYWNVKPDGATKLVNLLTQRLNRFQLPFRLKIVNNPLAYIRSDAAVLYLSKRFYRLASELLADIHSQLAQQLNPHTPLFSRKLASGLGLAEEPTTGESFGQQRCRILAHAIWTAYEMKHVDDSSRLRDISDQLQANGIDPEFPYRNAGSTEVYDFPA